MSFEWAEAEKRARVELARLQAELETPLPIEATNVLRGKIAALRWVIDLPTSAAPEIPDTMIQPTPEAYD